MSAPPAALSVQVTGIGLWAPGVPDVAAFLDRRDGAPADAAGGEPPPMPPADVANSRSKRGTSRICRMLVEVVTQAGRMAESPLNDAAVVLSSAWGEIDIMIGLLGQIAEDEPTLSPMRFKHSVHNAAGGLFSIATENRGLATSIAGGDRTFELGFLEAATIVATGRAPRALLGVAEDRLPPPLDRDSAHQGLAVGLCLEASASGREGLGRLTLVPGGDAPPARPDGVPDAWLDNPTAWGLPLVDALARGVRSRVPLGPSRFGDWLAVEPADVPVLRVS